VGERESMRKGFLNRKKGRSRHIHSNPIPPPILPLDVLSNPIRKSEVLEPATGRKERTRKIRKGKAK